MRSFLVGLTQTELDFIYDAVDKLGFEIENKEDINHDFKRKIARVSSLIKAKINYHIDKTKRSTRR